MRISMLLTLALASALITAPAGAAEVAVSQKSQKFNPDVASIKVGDTVRFNNDDTVAHNIMSAIPGGGHKNAGLQKTGESTTITYDQAGEFPVSCGIHPKMKMTVKVE